MDWPTWTETQAWLHAHPDWVLLMVFGLAALEALAVIGSIIPAVPIMVALTLLAGSMDINVWAVLTAAVAGAIVGDGISYAIGRRFQHDIEHVWPFRTHPHWLEASEAFVQRHGGKGLIIGRFIGPIRAFVPLAAGIFQMPLRRFLWFNVISALLWAPPNILPGYWAGSLVTHPLMPGQNQVIFVGGLLVAISLLLWFYPWLKGSTRRWRQGHAPVNRGIFKAADGHPDNQVLAALFCLGGLAGFTLLSLSLPALASLDQWLLTQMQALHHPGIDLLFAVFNEAGSSRFLLTFGGLFGIWLLLRQQSRALLYLVLVLALCLTVPNGLKQLFAIPRPELAAAVLDSYAYPSGHTYWGMVVWGFTYLLIGRALGDNARLWLLGVTLTLVVFVATARVFLGWHWSSDVAASLCLGLATLGALRWAWYRHDGLTGMPAWEPALAAGIALLISAFLWLHPLHELTTLPGLATRSLGA